MTGAEIIAQVLDAGGRITAAGGELVLTAPHALPVELLDRLRENKPAVLAALALTGVFVEWSAARGVTYRRLGPLPKVPAELHERVIITVGERSFESGHVSGGLTLVEWQARVLMAYGATASVRGVGP